MATSLVTDGTRHCSAYHSIVTKLEAKQLSVSLEQPKETKIIKTQLSRLSQYSYQAKATVTFRFTETKEVSVWETKKRQKTKKR